MGTPRHPTPPPTAEQYRSLYAELQETQRRYDNLLDVERNRTVDHKEAVARLDQARQATDEVREYYINRMNSSSWARFWLCILFFILGAAFGIVILLLAQILLSGAQTPGVQSFHWPFG